MATLKELRLQARLSMAGLGRLANVDGKTVRRAEEGLPIQEVKAVAIVETLAKQLNQTFKVNEIEGLHIYQ